MPQNFFCPLQKVQTQGKDIEVIAQSVNVCKKLWTDWLFRIKCKDATLGSAADGTADMGKRCCATASRQSETAPLRKTFCSLVYLPFQICNIGIRDSAGRLMSRFFCVCG